MTTIKTARLLLRPWKETDLIPFADMNADMRVMEHFPSIMSTEESHQLAHRIQSEFQAQGWGLWAVSLAEKDNFMGFIGLHKVDHSTFPAPFVPAIEIGWRLAHEYWGHGYATEGAKAALHYAFDVLGIPEIVSFTATLNLRSQCVMKKIGMHRYEEDDFNNPKIPIGHPLAPHVLYRIKHGQWKAGELRHQQHSQHKND